MAELDEQEEFDEEIDALDGLEREYYDEFKFRIFMYEGLLNTDEIILKGFRLTRNFIEKVVIDEVLFAHLPMRDKKKLKLRSHEDLGKLYPDSEAGMAKKEKAREEIFDKFIKENTLGKRKSKDDLEMFEDVFELTKKAWKKEEGFSKDDFRRFARNRASDPELQDIYKGWFEDIVSAAAMLVWEAIRLRKNPEIIEEKKVEKVVVEEEEEVAEKKPFIIITYKVKIAAILVAGSFLLIMFFYFTLKALLSEPKFSGLKTDKEAEVEEKISLAHLCGETWAQNPQNDIALLVKNNSKKEAYPAPKEEKKVYLPLTQGPFETTIGFKRRIDQYREIFSKCGYKVLEVKGFEAELLEKEKVYMRILEKCSQKETPVKKAVMFSRDKPN